MAKSNILPIILIGIGIILLFSVLGKGSGIGGIFTPKNKVTCDVTISTVIFGFGEIYDKKCVREKSYTCGIELSKSIIYREGTVRLLMDDGKSSVEYFKVYTTQMSKGVINVCSESQSGKIQLFDKDGNLRDEEVFTVA